MTLHCDTLHTSEILILCVRQEYLSSCLNKTRFLLTLMICGHATTPISVISYSDIALALIELNQPSNQELCIIINLQVIYIFMEWYHLSTSYFCFFCDINIFRA